uniref:Putative ovule protein n=1 Tax=Solanum chacoense TaxID=4108 RepID=A0A0V0GS00_SOLCH
MQWAGCPSYKRLTTSTRYYLSWRIFFSGKARNSLSPSNRPLQMQKKGQWPVGTLRELVWLRQLVNKE